MRVGALAEMTDEELRREEITLQEQIFRIRFRIGTGNVENPSKLRMTRRSLARVKTIMRERELKLKITHRRAEAEAPAADEAK